MEKGIQTEVGLDVFFAVHAKNFELLEDSMIFSPEATYIWKNDRREWTGDGCVGCLVNHCGCSADR